MATKKKTTKKATKPAQPKKKSTSSSKKKKVVTLRAPQRIGGKVKIGNKTYTVVKRVKGLEYQVK